MGWIRLKQLYAGLLWLLSRGIFILALSSTILRRTSVWRNLQTHDSVAANTKCNKLDTASAAAGGNYCCKNLARVIILPVFADWVWVKSVGVQAQSFSHYPANWLKLVTVLQQQLYRHEKLHRVRIGATARYHLEFPSKPSFNYFCWDSLSRLPLDRVIAGQLNRWDCNQESTTILPCR